AAVRPARTAEHVLLEHEKRHFGRDAEVAVDRATEVADRNQIALQFSDRPGDAGKNFAAVAMRRVIVAAADSAGRTDLEVSAKYIGGDCAGGDLQAQPELLDPLPWEGGSRITRLATQTLRARRTTRLGRVRVADPDVAVRDDAASRHRRKRLLQLCHQRDYR